MTGRKSASMLLRMNYSHDNSEKVQRIAGGTFLPEKDGGPGWKFILDMETCRRLRKEFGSELMFSEEILDWGTEKRQEADNLRKLANLGEISDTHLVRFRERLPDLAAWMRPYQLTGTNYIGQPNNNCLVADDPGLGKSVEVIGGMFEAGLDNGPILVVCPKMAIEDVWLKELTKWQPNVVFVAPEGKRQRDRLLAEVNDCLDMEEPFWLVVNPNMLTLRKSKNETDGFYDARTDSYYATQFPFISNTQWSAVIVDEAHLCGLSNPSSQTARALKSIKTDRRVAMTGTPAGGKAQRLWGILHWLDPEEYTSRTRWNDQWLKKVEFYDSQGNVRDKYEGIQDEREEQFYKAHAQYILRRKKTEVAKEMPHVIEIEKWVTMSPRQKIQYMQMKYDAEVKLEGKNEKLLSTNILSSYNWLKQFGNAYCDLEEKSREWSDEIDDWLIKYKAIPTTDCPKLEMFWSILEELDVTEGGDEQVIVFSQFRGMVDMIEEWLHSKKIDCVKITGDVGKRSVRQERKDKFQDGEVKIILMTTKAGGVAINLDKANTVVFFDEDWDPDVQRQAIDRADRISRAYGTTAKTKATPVTAYYIRTKGTVEERVKEVNDDKKQINDILLDIYRNRERDGSQAGEA